MCADTPRWREADLVRGGVESVLVVDRRQDLVDVGLEHHAAHDNLVENVVNLERGASVDREGGRILGDTVQKLGSR